MNQSVTSSSAASERRPGLVLVSIVIDIERIGDLTKNIVELALLHSPDYQEELENLVNRTIWKTV